MKVFLLVIMLLAHFSLEASAQIAQEAYHATLDASSSGILDVTIQLDQLPPKAIIYPQIVNKCIYEYSAPVARATLTVKNPAGKLIGSSQQNLIAKYQVSGAVASANSPCPNIPKGKVSLSLQINPHLTTKIKENVVLDLKLSPMEVGAASQTVDEKTGMLTLSDLFIGPSTHMVWKVYAADSNTPLALGEAKFSKN